MLACPGPHVVPDVGIQFRDQDAQLRGVKHSTRFVVCHVSSDVDKQVPTIKDLKKLSRTIAELDARPTRWVKQSTMFVGWHVSLAAGSQVHTIKSPQLPRTAFFLSFCARNGGPPCF